MCIEETTQGYLVKATIMKHAEINNHSKTEKKENNTNPKITPVDITSKLK